MTAEELIENGYKKYGRDVYDSAAVTGIFQKAFFDDDGKRKYFITWKRWDFGVYPQIRDEMTVQFEGKSQFQTKDGNYIEITLFSGWDLDESEKFVEKMFKTGFFNRYDDVM